MMAEKVLKFKKEKLSINYKVLIHGSSSKKDLSKIFLTSNNDFKLPQQIFSPKIFA